MSNCAGVSVGLWFHVGSAFEQKGEHGLSHFVEHMVFKGAGNKTAEDLSRSIDRVGGYLNAFTERDAVCIHCTLPKEHLELAMSTLLDMTFKPSFLEHEFEREKDIIANEIMASEDDLEDAGQDEFFASAYPDHPVGRRIAGSVEDVRSLTLKSLKSFHERYFKSGRITMTIAGAVDEKLAATVFRKTVKGRYKTPDAKLYKPGAAHFRASRKMVKASGSQVYFFSALPLSTQCSHDDFWNFSLISSAYGESMSSRLFMRLREKEGLCYSISSTFSLSRLGGLWGVVSSTTPAQFGKFALAYSEESQNLYTKGLSSIELKESITRIKGLLSLASDDSEYRMRRLARQFMFENTIESIDMTIGRFLESKYFSEESINSFISRNLDPSKENILLYGNVTKKTQKTGFDVFSASVSERCIS